MIQYGRCFESLEQEAIIFFLLLEAMISSLDICSSLFVLITAKFFFKRSIFLTFSQLRSISLVLSDHNILFLSLLSILKNIIHTTIAYSRFGTLHNF